MKSRWILNLLLLGSVAVLALIALYEPGIEQADEPQRLTTLDPSQIDRVRIQRARLPELVLARRGADDWVIESQDALPADPHQVNALIRVVEQTAVRSYPATQLDLAKLALEPPQASITVANTRFEFGATDPLEGLRYVRIGDRVHLSADLYQHLIDADFTQFVRRRLLPEEAPISALKLPALVLKKVDNGWGVEPQREVSADQIQQLIDTWRQATALSVKRATSETPGKHVEVVLDDPEQPIRYVIVTRDPSLILQRPDLGLEYRMGDTGEKLLDFAPASADPEQ
jgi:hypothetical protein